MYGMIVVWELNSFWMDLVVADQVLPGYPGIGRKAIYHYWSGFNKALLEHTICRHPIYGQAPHHLHFAIW